MEFLGCTKKKKQRRGVLPRIVNNRTQHGYVKKKKNKNKSSINFLLYFMWKYFHRLYFLQKKLWNGDRVIFSRTDDDFASTIFPDFDFLLSALFEWVYRRRVQRVYSENRENRCVYEDNGYDKFLETTKWGTS